MSEYILELDNITKKFPGVVALNKVSFRAKKGEILGLIGENGAGKSTLLKVLNGCYPFGSFEGTIKIDGKYERFYSTYDAHLKGIGYVPQEISVIDSLSVAENIFVGNFDKRFFNLKSTIERAKKLLNEINIDIDPKIGSGALSVSKKQLLMIARALSRKPKVLVLDEPTSALSSDGVENLFNIVKQLKQNGVSIIFVTHKLEEIMVLTDKVVILRDGYYVSNYERRDYKEEIIVSDMVGRKIENLFPKRNVSIGEEILRVENLSVNSSTRHKLAVDDLSFILHKGEVLGIAGLVGAGRTETLKAIYGSIPITKGRIFIEGREVNLHNVKTAMINGISMITEDRKKEGLLLLETIRMNINIANIDKVIRRGIVCSSIEESVAEKYMKLLNIRARNSKTIVVNLSGGNQQKVVIAKFLNTDPKIILMDDPTKGVDVGSKNEIYHLLNELSMNGVSIILTSSELPELINMCDKIIVLSKGVYKGEFKKEEATQEKVMHLCLK